MWASESNPNDKAELVATKQIRIYRNKGTCTFTVRRIELFPDGDLYKAGKERVFKTKKVGGNDEDQKTKT